MLTEKHIDVPTGLVLEKLAKWSLTINYNRPARNTVFDLAKVQHATPFGMLFVASCIRRYKRSVVSHHYDLSIPVLGTKSELLTKFSQGEQSPSCYCECNKTNSYLGHMGFWKSLGEDVGRAPGEARGGERYLPITCVKLEQLEAQAAAKSLEVGDVICDHTDRLAEVLTQQADTMFETTLAYSLRELFRNVFEHSESSQLWYAAQYWPTKNKVEIAVLDEGIGVQSSLAKNPVNVFSSNLRAIVMATERGVSGAVPKPTLRSVSGEPSESRWTNSGWGLFVLRELAARVGSLLVVSDSSAVVFSNRNIRSFECAFKGTVVRLVIEPSKIHNALQEILDKSTSDHPPSRLTPSMLARIRNSSS